MVLSTNYPVKVAINPISMPTANQVPIWNGNIFVLQEIIGNIIPTGSDNQVITHTSTGLIAEPNLLFNDTHSHVRNRGNTLHILSEVTDSNEFHIQLDDKNYDSHTGTIRYKFINGDGFRYIFIGEGNDTTNDERIKMNVRDGYVFSKRFGGFTYTDNYIDFDSSTTRINFFISGTNHIAFNKTGGGKVDVYASGDIIANTSMPSDLKLKKKIKPIKNSLDLINKLNGIRFQWKSDNRDDIGVIAQEVEKVLPEIVKDKQTFNGKDGETTKVVNYQLLTAILIEGVKELNSELKTLKEEIKQLKK